MIDPIRLAEDTMKINCSWRGDICLRRYWRFRGGKWYGGVATADCVGCNLRCKFCGPLLFMLKTRKHGSYKSPIDVVRILVSIAKRRGYRYLRISGGEPTICFDHIKQVLEWFNRLVKKHIFILETNGILIGARKEYAEMLSEYRNIHIRVSLKGTNEEEFEKLTMADRKYFEYQIVALKNLLNNNVSFHPAVVASFTTEENIEKLIDRLSKIDWNLARSLEIEYIVLYPHVVESLNRHNIVPTKAYTTDWRLIGSEEYVRLFKSHMRG